MSTGLLLFLAAGAAFAADTVNDPNQAWIQDLNRRTADYVKLHHMARAEVHGLKATSSPEAILSYQRRLAHRIREMRERVGQGNIFTPEIAVQFRRVIAAAMGSPSGSGIRATLRDEPSSKHGALRVDHPYLYDFTPETTPPSLLLNLPKLPPELQYRVVGRNLALLDIDANIVVDWIPNAIS